MEAELGEKIKQKQEKQLDEIKKISVEQKSANEIINTYEKEKRKLEELSGINLTQGPRKLPGCRE